MASLHSNETIILSVTCPTPNNLSVIKQKLIPYEDAFRFQSIKTALTQMFPW